MSLSSTRRMYRRITTNYLGWYGSHHTIRPVIMRDLSLNGFRVEGQADLLSDLIVSLRVQLPNGGGSIEIDKAVVRWKTEREFGVQIIALSNESDLRLARHVEHQLQHTMAHNLPVHAHEQVGPGGIVHPSAF
ncbi:MAG: PilZ domain-containing protein [Nitrospira sp.]|nr:PilZ domain-containing protein [Nitrospira sp.]